MNIKIITLITVSLFLFRCGNTSNEQSQELTSALTHEEHPQGNNVPVISLNNGTKWNSDQSTFTGMKRLELALYNFGEEHHNPAIADYNRLGVALTDIDNEIISQCSMKGKDHDQLHILLAPMLANVDVIKNDQDMVKLKVNTEELSAALVMFFEHFEVS